MYSSLKVEDRDARIRLHVTGRIIETGRIGRVKGYLFWGGLGNVGDFICWRVGKDINVYARQQFHLFRKQGRITRLDRIERDFDKTHLFTCRQGYLCSPISKAPSCAVIHVHRLSPI